MIAATGGAAAAAAAEAERLRQQEEEEMTPYTPKDLAEDWEFKIIRSNWGGFSNPEKLRAILEEEKRGGWTMVEKFDNGRIRLKRPTGTKVIEEDLASGGYDPYRTTVGTPSEGFVVLIALLIAGAIALILAAVAVGFNSP